MIQTDDLKAKMKVISALNHTEHEHTIIHMVKYGDGSKLKLVLLTSVMQSTVCEGLQNKLPIMDFHKA